MHYKYSFKRFKNYIYFCMYRMGKYRDQRVRPELRGHQVQMEIQELMGSLGLQEARVLRDRPGQQEPQDRLVPTLSSVQELSSLQDYFLYLLVYLYGSLYFLESVSIMSIF